MPRPLRTFVALKCSPSAVRAFRRWSDKLAAIDSALHAPKTDDYHLTVQFLGDTVEQDVPDIARALEEAVEELPSFDVCYRGIGAFPEPARARVVWAGVEEVEPAGHLAALSDAVGLALEPLGHAPERRAWHPHVTLGRVKRRPSADLVAAVQGAATEDLGDDRVSELKLILSAPGNRGYRYIDLTTVELA